LNILSIYLKQDKDGILRVLSFFLLSSGKAARAERCPPKTTAAALDRDLKLAFLLSCK